MDLFYASDGKLWQSYLYSFMVSDVSHLSGIALVDFGCRDCEGTRLMASMIIRHELGTIWNTYD